MTFQAWKIKFLNSMTFQVFHDLYEPDWDKTNKQISILNNASPLSCPTASLILQHGNFIECELQAAKGRNCCKQPTYQSIPFFGYLLHSL